MNGEIWKASLKEFFVQRGAAVISDNPSLSDLAYVSGRDPRVWSQEIYQDLISNIADTILATPTSQLIEVGCASGFLAYGLSSHVGSYLGLDLAEPPLIVARRLGLKNASFTVGDGASLNFDDKSFDSAISYDVFTNFPSFEEGSRLIREMYRVTKPGGRVLIGSIPDIELEHEYIKRVAEVSKDLNDKYGALNQNYDEAKKPSTYYGWKSKILQFLKSPVVPVEASIYCYYFQKSDFLKLANNMGCECEIVDIHSLNPYFGFRFNAVFKKN